MKRIQPVMPISVLAVVSTLYQVAEPDNRWTFVCIYIYIYKQYINTYKTFICIYIYIYMYICTYHMYKYTCIYIYIPIQQLKDTRLPHRCSWSWPLILTVTGVNSLKKKIYIYIYTRVDDILWNERSQPVFHGLTVLGEPVNWIYEHLENINYISINSKSHEITQTSLR